MTRAPLKFFWFLSTTALCSAAQLPTTTLNRTDINTELLTNDQFADYNSLVYLYLVDNNIKEIDEYAFVRLESLSHLDLSYNKIEALHLETFTENRVLETLSLRANPLAMSAEVSVVVSLSLATLDLSHCNISTLFPGTLSGVPSLISLDLSFNRLSHISADDFHFVTLLTRASMRGNPWRCCRGGTKAFMVSAVEDEDEMRCYLTTSATSTTLWSNVDSSVCEQLDVVDEKTESVFEVSGMPSTVGPDSNGNLNNVVSSTGIERQDGTEGRRLVDGAIDSAARSEDAWNNSTQMTAAGEVGVADPGSSTSETSTSGGIDRLGSNVQVAPKTFVIVAVPSEVVTSAVNTTGAGNENQGVNEEEEKTWNILMTVAAMGGVVFLGILLGVLWTCGKRNFRSAVEKEPEETELYNRVPYDDDYYK